MRAWFTKGPWSVFVAGSTLAVEPRADANGTRPNIVDWTGFDSNDQPYSVNRANAHLIAAAPDMYEALEKAQIAVAAISDSAVEAGFGRLANLFDEVMTDAKSALAKARGEAK